MLIIVQTPSRLRATHRHCYGQQTVDTIVPSPDIAPGWGTGTHGPRFESWRTHHLSWKS